MEAKTPKQSRSRYYVSKRAKGSTSVRRILREKRIAEALDYRTQGHSVQAIASQMKISKSTARQYILEAMQKFVDRESAEHALLMELRRLDELQGAFFHNATKGDAAACEQVLKIMSQRARLLGLNQDKGTGISLSFGGNGLPDAEQVGIQVTFVAGHNGKLVEGELLNGQGHGLAVIAEIAEKPIPVRGPHDE